MPHQKQHVHSSQVESAQVNQTETGGCSQDYSGISSSFNNLTPMGEVEQQGRFITGLTEWMQHGTVRQRLVAIPILVFMVTCCLLGLISLISQVFPH